ncbi:MAG: DNA polymerase IV [Candidatus Hydrogenedentota bacterium]|nr:MAG: DNA polymerase IV [Candidatus Hydrogenedentota bacterium]
MACSGRSASQWQRNCVSRGNSSPWRPRARVAPISARAPTMTRTIIHVDMDAFYASIEQRDNPSLMGKPVIVGGVGGQRGVVSAASYEARRYGVRSAMPLRSARRLCPEGTYLPVDMEKYHAVSERLRSILSSYTPNLEPISLDEAFLDVTASTKLCGSAERMGREIKERVRNALNLTASVGIAPNKFLAKMASDHGKPDGLVVIQPGGEADFLRDLPVDRMHGVGKVMARHMAEHGIDTIGRLAEMSREELRRLFGKHGERLHELSLGIDNDEVVAEAEAKSISHETTFDVDVEDREELRRTLASLSDRVGERLREERLVAATIGIKVRLADFSTVHRERTLSEVVDGDDQIFMVAWNLFQALPLSGQKVRLLGVVASGLERPSGQLQLFSEMEKRSRRTMSTIDNIRRRFGHAAIGRASQAKPANRRKTSEGNPIKSRKEQND